MNRYKKLAALGLAVILSAGMVFPVSASDEASDAVSDEASDVVSEEVSDEEIESAQSEMAATQDDLDEVRNTIDDLEVKKEALTGEIDELQGKLVRTISGIKTLNSEVDDLTVQMERTTADLVVAEEDKDVQYEAMKKRIQYLYETGGEAGWATVFLGGGNLSDMLDKAEYTQQMYKYDRSQLEEYLSIIATVEALQTKQYEDKSALETRKHEQEEAQEWLETLLTEAEEKYDDYDERIAEAYAMADEYQALITAQNEAIAQLIEAQEAMGVTEEEAAYVAQQIVDSYYANGGDAAVTTDVYTPTQQVVTTPDTTDTGNAYVGATDNAGTGTTADNNTGEQTTRSTTNYTQGNEISQSANTSSQGQAILQYAQQFIGNPYVYGGNSLTDGVDCSGFVQQVMANFGISTQRTSWGQETDGTAVSYNDVQVGDLIIYDGHSAIYAGNNQVINAIDEAHGIGYSDVNSGQIVAIRRLVDEDAPAATDTYTDTSGGTYTDTTYTDDSASYDTASYTDASNTDAGYTDAGYTDAGYTDAGYTDASYTG